MQSGANPFARRLVRLIAAAQILGSVGLTAAAAADFTVTLRSVNDEKAVFATLEGDSVVAARARIGGTVERLTVREGDVVRAGQVIGAVADEKLALQIGSLDAQIAALKAQVDQSQTDLARIEPLVKSGVLAKSRLDQARTALDVAQNSLTAQIGQRSVLSQQLAEGEILAPAGGRILTVPLTKGSVVMPGETVAMVSDGTPVLRLRVPERHARFLKQGDAVRIDGAEFDTKGPVFGRVTLVYPQIEDGRVIADAAVEGIDPYFVGARIRVWISAGSREAFIIPGSFVFTHFGVDYVLLEQDGKTIQVPVQRGLEHPLPQMPDGIEILSGLSADDHLVQP